MSDCIFFLKNIFFFDFAYLYTAVAVRTMAAVSYL